MRCVDCLPFIEEYFDGETDARTGELLSAHLRACADCAAAFDALQFEQEIFMRYERGLEVSPALWAGVSAEMAREPLPDKDSNGRPFLSYLREGFAATLGAFAVRPALASTLALLFVGVTAGVLWLARMRPVAPRANNETLAKNETDGGASVNPPSAANVTPPTDSSDVQGGNPPIKKSAGGELLVEGAVEPGSRREPGGRFVEVSHTPAPVKSAPDESVEKVIAWTPAATVNRNIVVINADDHEAREDSPLFVNTASTDRGAMTTDARLADPGDKEVARHVEKTQMLLRSFKNARPTEDDTVNVAYEKTLSRRLLAENATLQLDAETRGDKDTQQLLDQIEPFLLDIANLRDHPSREEVRSVRERMKKTEIIAALQVY